LNNFAIENSIKSKPTSLRELGCALDIVGKPLMSRIL
jgi:hypothetical protein